MSFFLTNVHGSTATLVGCALIFGLVGLGLLADGISLLAERKHGRSPRWIPSRPDFPYARDHPGHAVLIGTVAVSSAVLAVVTLIARALA